MSPSPLPSSTRSPTLPAWRRRSTEQLGVPVSPDAGELAGVEATSLPAGRAAVLRHIGPYQGLRAAFEQLRSWIDERGETAGGAPWEAYVSHPRTEPDASKLITDIYQPLR